MKIVLLNFDYKQLNQSIETVLPINGEQRRVYIELRYLEATEKWYLTMVDAESGESYFRYVPVVACYNELNDLILPFSYKDIGMVFCVSMVDNPDSVNPEKEDMRQFAVVWGDAYDE